jgi:hypothetical protein
MVCPARSGAAPRLSGRKGGEHRVRVVLGNKALWMSGAARTARRHGEGAPKQTGDIARSL